MPGMTSAQTPRCQPAAGQWTMCRDCGQRVFRTARQKATGRRQHRADRIPVKANGYQQPETKQAGHPRQQPMAASRHPSQSGHDGARAIALRISRSSSARHARLSAPRGSCSQSLRRRRNLIMARSGLMAGDQSTERHASRATRFRVLRSTAWGNRRLGTDSPSRGFSA